MKCLPLPQAFWYKNILARNYAALTTEDSQVSLLNIAMELRKASSHPYLFDGAETPGGSREDQFKGLVQNSGKMYLLDKLLSRLKQDGHRVLIFSQMVRMLDILSDYCALRGYIYQRLDGTVPSETRRKSIEHYNAPDSPDFVFLLSTRAGGLGINLETADTVIIFDSDWNPQNDLQAMARAHRIGQKSHVSVYRLVTKDTVEEDVLERAKRKMVLEYAIINQMDTSGTNLGKSNQPKMEYSKDELGAILKFGASTIFNKSEADLAKLEEMDLDDIINKAEAYETATAPTGTSLGGEDFLNQFAAVQDVKADMTSWDDIIPLADREKMQSEKNKRDTEELAAQRKRAAVSYSGADGEREDPDKSPKDSKSGAPRKNAAQRSMDLKEKDVRALVRGIQKFGDIRHRYDLIAKEAKLESKNRTIVQKTADEIISLCRKAVAQNKNDLKAKQAAGDDVSKPKAVLVTYEKVSNINAETTVSRMDELKILHDRMYILCACKPS